MLARRLQGSVRGAAVRAVRCPRRALAWAPAHGSLPRHRTARDLYSDMMELTKSGGDFTVRNYMAIIEDMSSPEAALVETELFPRGALEFYTKWNMGDAVEPAEEAEWRHEMRGGAQGDYRRGMREKVANAIDCLRTHPTSKRASIPIPFAEEPSKAIDWRDAGQTKCCRELYLYLEGGRLCCLATLRMQNAVIFPKNIHFFATLLDRVATDLRVPVGEYTHIIANLCHDRSAQHC